MNKDYLSLKTEAIECLNQMTIIDGDANINSILFELIETDNTNIEIKKQLLEDIKKLLSVKSQLKVKNDDLYFLRNLSEKLKRALVLEEVELKKLFDIIKNNF